MKYVKGPYEIKLYCCIKKQDQKRKIGFLIFYLSHFLLKKFLDPFIGQKNNSSDYGLHGTQNDRLELTVSTQKIGFEIYTASPEILAKMYPNIAFQAKFQKCLTFLPISLGLKKLCSLECSKWKSKCSEHQMVPFFHCLLLVFMKMYFLFWP